MASASLSQHDGKFGAAAVTDPTVDLKTLVTALESLLTLAQTQLYISSSTTNTPTLDSLSIASSNLNTSSTLPSSSIQGEPSSLPYVDGALSGTVEEEEERLKAWEETESHVRRKLIEIHSKLKNGCIPWDEDESLLLEQENASEKVRHRKLSQHEQQHLALVPGNHHHANDDEDDVDEGETDEGTVSDPSPSPHLPKAPVSGGGSSHQHPPNKVLSASTGPGSETAEVMISQTVRILHSAHGFASETKALAAQLLAELAKTLNGRSLCLHYRTILPPYLLLQRSNVNGENNVEDNERDEKKVITSSVSVVEAVARVLGPECPLETSVQVYFSPYFTMLNHE